LHEDIPATGSNGAEDKLAAAVRNPLATSAELPESRGAAQAVLDVEAEAAAAAAQLTAAGGEAGQGAGEPAPRIGGPLGNDSNGDSSTGPAALPGGSATYHSRFMQQLAASASDDDLAVYTADDATGAPRDALQPPSRGSPEPVPQAGDAPPAGRMQPLSIASGDKGVASDNAAALAAINAASGSTPEGQQAAAPQAGTLFPQSWYQTFHGEQAQGLATTVRGCTS
jgi:hypothetical protein